VEERNDLGLDLAFVVNLAWRLTLERREYRTPCGGNDFVEEDLATLGFVLTTLSLYLFLVSSYLWTVVSALMKLI